MSDVDTPRDFPALRSLIVERAADFPRRLTQVATYALENPDDIAFGTVASIAQAASVQPSTLVRFAQSLGYQGFSELQEVFQSRLRDRVLNYDERIVQLREHTRKSGKAGLVFDGFAGAAEQSLARMRERLDTAQLEEAADMLAGAETIYLIGLRRSFPISSYMAYALGKLGIRYELVDGLGGLGHEQTGFATAKDVAVAISFTPYASETVSLVKRMAERKVPVVAITDSPLSPLASIARVWFEVQEANFEGFRSMAATITLAISLTIATAERRAR
ncbi:MAG: MurR/RpiR family transcriptional regulator [Rhizobiales bacterium]|nr:MurR/RpiR family transcriptional regulator [Hyphomicrobiales bacterium]